MEPPLGALIAAPADSSREHDLTGKAALTAGASLIEYAVRSAVTLLITPLLLGALGRSLFGVWEMLMRLAAYPVAVDGRAAESLSLVVANGLGASEPRGLRRSVGSALYVWLLFLPLASAAGVAVVWLAPSITRAPVESTSSVRLAAALLVASFLINTAASIPRGALAGANLGYARLSWVVAAHLLTGALMAFAIQAGAGLAGIAGAHVAASVAALIVFVTMARTLLPKFGATRPHPKALRRFVRLSTWTVAGDLVSRVVLASDAVILGALATSAAVTSYVLTAYAATALVAILSVVLLAAAPGLGALIGGGQIDRARGVRDELMVLSWLAATASGATLLLCNRAFVALWVGPGQYAGRAADLLIALLMVQTILIRADAYVINTTLRVRGRVIGGAVAAVVSIVLASALTPVYQIAGLCLGLGIGRLLQNIWHPLLVRRLLGPARSAAPDGLRRLVVTAILFGTFVELGGRVNLETWLEWIAVAGASVLVTPVVAWRVGLAPVNRDLVRKRIGLALSSAAGPLAGQRMPS